MNKENLLKFFELEYNNTKRILDDPTWFTDRDEPVWRGISRCYGAAMFLNQCCDGAIAYEEIEDAFNEVRDRFCALIED